MKVFCATASLIFVATPVQTLAAGDYAHFPVYAADGWTVNDEGEERCDADFSVDGVTVLGIIGPYYFRPGEPTSGNIIDLVEEANYKLPKGDKEGEFPAELVAGAARFTVSGFATDLGNSLVVDSGSMPTVIDLLAALPDNVTLRATVEGRQIYAIALTGNRGAAKALQDCTAFIAAQNRPGTKNGPKLGAPKPEMLREPPPERVPEPIIEAPPVALPEAGPPEALPSPR